MCAPAAATWPKDILRQLHYYRMADQVISTCVSFEKPIGPLRVAIAVRIEDLLPHAAVNVDLARCQHRNATASTQQKALLVVPGQLFGAQQHRRGLPCRKELDRWVAIDRAGRRVPLWWDEGRRGIRWRQVQPDPVDSCSIRCARLTGEGNGRREALGHRHPQPHQARASWVS